MIDRGERTMTRHARPSGVSFARRSLVVTALAAFIAACSPKPPHADLRAIPGQNVLLVTIDTLRADALGSYGGAAATPALDRLAAEGVRFTFAHAHAVVTLASHASILTGRYPYQHGIRDNSGYRLPPDTPTIATRLKDAGYATGAFVAAFPLHSRFGLNRGFDIYDERFGETNAPTDLVMPERPASAVVPLARDWIRAHDDRKWFVWTHVFDPHAPYQPPAPFAAQYAGNPYYGEVAAVDAALAPLLEDVRASGRPTLVIVTADHGESLGEHGEATHGLFAYEATLRVPLIFAELGRANVNGGEVADVAMRHVDIAPTVLDAVGLPAASDLSGISVLSSESRTSSAPRPTYFEAMGGFLNRGWAPLTGVIADREKLIDLPILERYELASDAGERANLAGRAPDRDRRLTSVLRGFDAGAVQAKQTEDADAAARLRALGYVSGSAAPKRRYTDADDPKNLVDVDAQMHRAVEAFGAGRVADASALYKQIIERRPDMAIAYQHLAFVLARQGDLPGAIDLLQRGVRRGITDPGVLTLLGGYLADTGKIEQGVQILEPLTRNRDASADTLNTLGIAYAQAHRLADAQRMFERGHALDPNSSVPLENLGMLALDRGDLNAARSSFQQAIAGAPRSSRAHAGLGLTAFRAGDHAAAIAEWKTAVDLDANNLEALYNLATALARGGQMTEARPLLERFLRVAPASAVADRREVTRLLNR